MRTQLTIAAAASLLLSACSGETVARPPPPPVNWSSLREPAASEAVTTTPTAQERSAAEAYVAALASPGLSALGPRLDDDAHFAFPGSADAHGRASVLHSHDALFGAFEPREVTANRVWRTSAEQAVEWTMVGVQARDFMGVAATHKPVSVKGVALLWTKDDGSISDVHLYFDVGAVKSQLGADPKEPRGLWSPAGAGDARSAGAAKTDAGASRPPVVLEAAPRAPSPAGPQVFEQTGSPVEQANLTLAKAALDALENNNEPAYESTMGDNLEVYTLQSSQPARSKDSARAYFKASHRAIGQLDTTVTDARGVGPFAVVEYFIAGEQLGPIGWIPVQRDKVVRFHVVDVIEAAGSKIVRIWRYENPAEIIEAPPG